MVDFLIATLLIIISVILATIIHYKYEEQFKKLGELYTRFALEYFLSYYVFAIWSILEIWQLATDLNFVSWFMRYIFINLMFTFWFGYWIQKDNYIQKKLKEIFNMENELTQIFIIYIIFLIVFNIFLIGLVASVGLFILFIL